jgi:hypothetical protein
VSRATDGAQNPSMSSSLSDDIRIKADEPTSRAAQAGS